MEELTNLEKLNLQYRNLCIELGDHLYKADKLKQQMAVLDQQFAQMEMKAKLDEASRIKSEQEKVDTPCEVTKAE